MIDLIYDRAAADVSEVKALSEKAYKYGWDSLTESEHEAWLKGRPYLLATDGRVEATDGYLITTDEPDGVIYGAYNPVDLNRVETACKELAALSVSIPADLKAKAEELGVAWDSFFDVSWSPVSLTTKTDWNMEDLPTVSNMARYLSNVKTLTCLVHADYPALPDSMNRMNWQGANAIEQALAVLYDALTAEAERINHALDLVPNAWIHAGAVSTGII